MYNTKTQEQKMINTCMEKKKDPKKKGESVFYGKCGKNKKLCKCK